MPMYCKDFSGSSTFSHGVDVQSEIRWFLVYVHKKMFHILKSIFLSGYLIFILLILHFFSDSFLS